MMCDVRLLFLLVLSHVFCFAGDRTTTVSGVVELVLDSSYSDHDDQRLARALQSVHLKEQLTPSTVAYLENLGVGMKTTAALEDLRGRSTHLPLPSELGLAGQTPPPREEQAQILQRLFAYVQSYIHSLPNFLCDEVTRRYSNLERYSPDGNPHYGTKLHHGDNFIRHLRYVSGLDEGRVEQVSKHNGENVETKMGESISTGEFGGDMTMIFGLGVEPELRWHHWEISRTGRTAVFSYFVGLAKTRFDLLFCCFLKRHVGEMQQKYRAPIRGLVYVDTDSGTIARLCIRAVNLPSDFRLKESNTIIDYGSVNIGGRFYTLPLKASIFARTDIQYNRNEISFIKYRKFEAESVFTSTESKIKYKWPSEK